MSGANMQQQPLRTLLRGVVESMMQSRVVGDSIDIGTCCFIAQHPLHGSARTVCSPEVPNRLYFIATTASRPSLCFVDLPEPDVDTLTRADVAQSYWNRLFGVADLRSQTTPLSKEEMLYRERKRMSLSSLTTFTLLPASRRSPQLQKSAKVVRSSLLDGRPSSTNNTSTTSDCNNSHNIKKGNNSNNNNNNSTITDDTTKTSNTTNTHNNTSTNADISIPRSPHDTITPCDPLQNPPSSIATPSSGCAVLPCFLVPGDALWRVSVVSREECSIGEVCSASVGLVGSRMDVKVSPVDGDVVAFVRDNDLYTCCLNSGAEHRLTYSTEQGLCAGVAEFIIQEEFNRYTGYWWRPVVPTQRPGCPQQLEHSLLYIEVDEKDVMDYIIPAPGIEGVADKSKYPLPGSDNAHSQLRIVEFACPGGNGGALRRVIRRLDPPLSTRFPWCEYVVRCGWMGDGTRVWAQLMNRKQTRLSLVVINVDQFVELDHMSRDVSISGVTSPTPPPPASAIPSTTSALDATSDPFHSSSDPGTTNSSAPSVPPSSPFFPPPSFVTAPSSLSSLERNRHGDDSDSDSDCGAGLARGSSCAPEDAGLGVSVARREYNDGVWINVTDLTHVLSDGRILWTSEGFESFRHIYLLTPPSAMSTENVESGDDEWSVVPITTGDWEVDRNTQLFVDERRSLVFFMANKETPLEQHLYVAAYGDTYTDPYSVIRLTEGNFSHEVAMSEDRSVFVSTYSNICTPFQTAVYRIHHRAAAAENGPCSAQSVGASRIMDIVGPIQAAAAAAAPSAADAARDNATDDNGDDSVMTGGDDEAGLVQRTMSVCDDVPNGDAKGDIRCMSIADLDDGDDEGSGVNESNDVKVVAFLESSFLANNDDDDDEVMHLCGNNPATDGDDEGADAVPRCDRIDLTSFAAGASSGQSSRNSSASSLDPAICPSPTTHRTRSLTDPPVAPPPLANAPPNTETTPTSNLRLSSPPPQQQQQHQPAPPRSLKLPAGFPKGIEPVLFNLKSTRTGETLYGCMYRPPQFDRNVKYPVMVYVYGGPQVQLVRNSWDLSSGSSIKRQMMACVGHVVVVLDNVGSSNRGLRFESHVRRQLGSLEVSDQVDAIQYLVKREGYLDPSRVCVSGWSYGGYLSLMCLAQRPDVFKMAVAGAPVTEWEAYDTGYTERYMDLPLNNPIGYEEGSVLTWAYSFPDDENRLLVIHGMIDENVHFCHTTRLIEALIHNNKPYAVELFPDERHGTRKFRNAVYLETRVLSFILQNL